jgi:hypothetical protein
MNILFTGRGGAGSWTIRAEQIGGALGARVKPHATLDDCRWADVIVVVKRIPNDLLARIRQSGTPWVYDIVDAYPQPECSTWEKPAAVGWLDTLLTRLQPSAVIWPNARMGEDLAFELKWQGREAPCSIVLRHHQRPGIRVNPIRPEVKRIGYEGSAAYLNGWMPAIEEQCSRIGAEFVLNPTHLADVDVVLALRDKNHAGYPQRHWKSNVKLANAHGSGTPFIGMPESGYQETTTGCEYWATTGAELGTALDWLASQSAREQVSERFLQAAIPIDAVAGQYREFLCALKS